jgi:hypothetical protein
VAVAVSGGCAGISPSGASVSLGFFGFAVRFKGAFAILYFQKNTTAGQASYFKRETAIV